MQDHSRNNKKFLKTKNYPAINYSIEKDLIERLTQHKLKYQYKNTSFIHYFLYISQFKN